ncbi:conserved hypothetical protein [Anaeromyxobacter sp. K]|uniref:tetratricopeptide repeat protein n=1 Tax=Anaeromyxobacter sp. (strain K) TaxID=447217 RepID=UPI00015F9C2F|nr:tetratricopeptide repeat protein [Anaeromyxobacter sp. K]ACG71421.1 conserved hypothetical protein [Anaeromyxobacter sp. K]
MRSRTAHRPARKAPPTIDRTATLALADRARARGRRRKAVALYQRVLAQHPDDLAVHGKVAPLLAARGDRDGALRSFRAAIDGHRRAGFVDRALAVLAQATEAFPRDDALWDEMANLELSRGRRADAVAALVRGGRTLLAARALGPAERLLHTAGRLEPWHGEATLLLARAWARSGRRRDAVRLLEGLAERTGGRTRAAARALALRLSPTPSRLWRWLRRGAAA